MHRQQLLKVCPAVFAAVLFALAARAPGADAPTAKERESKLLAVLASDSPAAEKAITCKRLAVYGSKDAVPALAALLPNAELSSWARIALEVIPGPEADEALRQAAANVQGRLLIGVINSIGVRHDAKAVDVLAGKLKDADAEVASAAAVALGCVGNAPAAEVLRQSLAGAPPAVRGAVAEGCVRSAEKFLAENKQDEAVKLYDLVRKADLPKQRILEATRGAILARKADGLPLLVEQLKSADKSLFNIGLRTARELPGREVTEALIAELGRATPERQQLLGLALADRGDPAALPAVLQAAKTGPDHARVVAIGMLKKLGDASCVPLLLDAAMEGNEVLSREAVDVLGELRGPRVDEAIAARLAKAEGKARLVLIPLAGQRRIQAAVPLLLKTLEDADAQARAAAVTALGYTIEFRDLAALIDRVAKPQGSAEEAKAAEDSLTAACTRMADREACAEKLVLALTPAPVPTKIKFLEVLTAMGGPKALAAVAAAAKDSNAEIQDAGSRLLGEWMTADAAPVLLDLAKADSKHKTRALRGYLRIARQLNLSPDQRMTMHKDAWALCQRNEEKRLALQVLGRIPTAESLAMLVAHLNNTELKAEAARAAVMVGQKLVQTDAPAVAKTMALVIEANVHPDVTAKAKVLLDKAEKDPAK